MAEAVVDIVFLMLLEATQLVSLEVVAVDMEVMTLLCQKELMEHLDKVLVAEQKMLLPTRDQEAEVLGRQVQLHLHQDQE
jgi:hypothetical protein